MKSFTNIKVILACYVTELSVSNIFEQRQKAKEDELEKKKKEHEQEKGEKVEQKGWNRNTANQIALWSFYFFIFYFLLFFILYFTILRQLSIGPPFPEHTSRSLELIH